MSNAIAEPSRAAGLSRLGTFARNAGSRYAKTRNFDFGPGRRGNVSMLSPYVRHRLVLEQELVEAALELHAFSTAGKFVQEVFWRTYFKGWLEHRPRVWADYSDDLVRLVGNLESDSKLHSRYSKAVRGNTGIDCFDAWAKELVSTGYLHNHARMWFASIWVFTLGLPWQLGADFFFRNLIDGDPASNTLSWRWVCGLHTKGKIYLARPSNIAKFTDNRFNPEGQLAAAAPALVEERTYPIELLPVVQALPTGERFGLLVTEEDGCPVSLLGSRAPAAILGVVATGRRSPLPIGVHASNFTHGAVADAVSRTVSSYGVDGDTAETEDWSDAIVEWAKQHGLRTVATAYAPVGPTAELLAKTRVTLDHHGISLLQLRRAYDDTAWPHAQRGFFKLKNEIPQILERLALTTSENYLDCSASTRSRREADSVLGPAASLVSADAVQPQFEPAIEPVVDHQTHAPDVGRIERGAVKFEPAKLRNEF